jgi:hypothetical protein
MAVLVAASPALPLHTAGKYVAGAYVVLFALVLIYVAIMAIRMSRIERELGELLSEAARNDEGAVASEGHASGPDRQAADQARAPRDGVTQAAESKEPVG